MARNYGKRRINNLKRKQQLSGVKVNINVTEETRKFAQKVAWTISGAMIVSSLINLSANKK